MECELIQSFPFPERHCCKSKQGLWAQNHEGKPHTPLNSLNLRFFIYNIKIPHGTVVLGRKIFLYPSKILPPGLRIKLTRLIYRRKSNLISYIQEVLIHERFKDRRVQ